MKRYKYFEAKIVDPPLPNGDKTLTSVAKIVDNFFNGVADEVPVEKAIEDSKMKTPKVGDIIYVDSHFYLSHGVDDFVGGKAHVIQVYKDMSGGEMCDFISIAEKPSSRFNWTQFLAKEQDELAVKFGDSWSHSDPDLRPEMNEGW